MVSIILNFSFAFSECGIFDGRIIHCPSFTIITLPPMVISAVPSSS
jgi:hypothetical protein